MEHEVGLLKKIATTLRKQILDKDELGEFDSFADMIAVGIFYDKTITASEKEKAKEIIDEVFGDDAKFVFNLVMIKVEEFDKKNYVFEKIKDNVLRKIVAQNRWEYAEYLIKVFESDGVSSEEAEAMLDLKKIIQHRKALMNKLGLKD